MLHSQKEEKTKNCTLTDDGRTDCVTDQLKGEGERGEDKECRRCKGCRVPDRLDDCHSLILLTIFCSSAAFSI